MEPWWSPRSPGPPKISVLASLEIILFDPGGPSWPLLNNLIQGAQTRMLERLGISETNPIPREDQAHLTQPHPARGGRACLWEPTTHKKRILGTPKEITKTKNHPSQKNTKNKSQKENPKHITNKNINLMKTKIPWAKKKNTQKKKTTQSHKEQKSKEQSRKTQNHKH